MLSLIAFVFGVFCGILSFMFGMLLFECVRGGGIKAFLERFAFLKSHKIYRQKRKFYHALDEDK